MFFPLAAIPRGIDPNEADCEFVSPSSPLSFALLERFFGSGFQSGVSRKFVRALRCGVSCNEEERLSVFFLEGFGGV